MWGADPRNILSEGHYLTSRCLPSDAKQWSRSRGKDFSICIETADPRNILSEGHYLTSRCLPSDAKQWSRSRGKDFSICIETAIVIIFKCAVKDGDLNLHFASFCAALCLFQCNSFKQHKMNQLVRKIKTILMNRNGRNSFYFHTYVKTELFFITLTVKN